ncbi:MAG TPA: metallophosphoesterase, partial [Kofleriaceae bacterium]|nr:metallophosphoesterase [Kofleriaceae bacterium]
MRRLWLAVPLVALGVAAMPATSAGGRFQKAPLERTVRGHRFAVLGDGGGDRAGQRRVARTLRRAHARRPFDSVLLLGDNAHEGRSFRDAIDRPYRKLARRGVRFFPVLGNHDVSQGAARARAQRKHFGVPRHYKVSPAPGVDAFAIDTTLFQKGSDELYGPRVEALRRRELAWLDRQLAASRARYKIVYGHHSMYTSVRAGDPEQTAPLRERLEPILTRNQVALYLAGHYHYYERTAPIGGVTHMVSGGGGSKLVAPDRRAPHPRQVAVPEHHVVLFERVKGGLRFETVSASGETLDR